MTAEDPSRPLSDRLRAYATKRSADGLNRREILRCLKRYIARQTYHTLRHDLKALNGP
jgi:transposase